MDIRNVLLVSVAQMDSVDDKKKNLAVMRKMIENGKDSDIVCFPESSLYRGGDDGKTASGETLNGPSVTEVRDMAVKTGVSVMFCFLEKTDTPSKVFNTTVLVSPSGSVNGVYRKIHLFDVTLPGGVSTLESASVLAGTELGMSEINDHKIGMMTCYDLRFPELARRLTAKRARVLFIPADFTAETGRDHWEVLLRARAIENQVYIVAPNQMGSNPVTGIKSYGRSVIINPWGTVTNTMPDEGGIMCAELDFDVQDDLRKRFPVLEHIKDF